MAAQKSKDTRVHMVDYASQPNIQYRCDSTWSTPDWVQGEQPPGVFLADDGRLYTFTEEKITCGTCIEMGPTPPKAA